MKEGGWQNRCLLPPGPLPGPPSLCPHLCAPQGAPSPPCSAVTPGRGGGSPLWGDSALTPQQHHVKALGGGCLPFPSVSSLPLLPFAPTANIFQLPPLPQSDAIKEPTKQQQLRPVRTELPSLAQRCCGEAGGCCAPPPPSSAPPREGRPSGDGGNGVDVATARASAGWGQGGETEAQRAVGGCSAACPVLGVWVGGVGG